MADNKLELVVQVDVDKANASIKRVNADLSSMEQTAAKTARGAAIRTRGGGLGGYRDPLRSWRSRACSD